MTKILRLNKSGFNAIIKHLISEQKEMEEKRSIGVKTDGKSDNSRLKPFWNEGDQLMALYNEKYGIEDIWPGEFRSESQRREDFANQIIGSTGASLLKQGLNFRRLRTQHDISPQGYSREAAEMQKLVFDKYDHMNRQEVKNIVIDIIEKRLKTPEAIERYKRLKKTTRLRNAAEKAAAAQKRSHEMFPKLYPPPEGYVKPSPKKRYDIKKSPEPVPEPEPIPEPTPEPEPEKSARETLQSIYNRLKSTDSPEEINSMASELEDVRNKIDEKDARNYIRSIYKRMVNVKSADEINSIADEIDFLLNYLDMDLTEEEADMISEMLEFVRNKNMLIESMINKTVNRIKNLNNLI